MKPFITVVLIPTAGHIESTSRKMGFSLSIPLTTSCRFVLSVATVTFSEKSDA
jgi:hypothetical protein